MCAIPATLPQARTRDEWQLSEDTLGTIDSQTKAAQQEQQETAAAALPAQQEQAPAFEGISDLDAKLDALFKSVDADSSGTIERGEVKKLVIALGLASDDPKLEKFEEDQAMADADQDGDGKIDLAEFKEHMSDFLEMTSAAEFEANYRAAMAASAS